jgi:hypothetical protein
MPYGVVLEDERRTSNIERPTSNEKTNIHYRTFNLSRAPRPRATRLELVDKSRGRKASRACYDYFCFFSAVLILVTKILINSSVSCKTSFSSSGFLMSGTR